MPLEKRGVTLGTSICQTLQIMTSFVAQVTYPLCTFERYTLFVGAPSIKVRSEPNLCLSVRRLGFKAIAQYVYEKEVRVSYEIFLHNSPHR